MSFCITGWERTEQRIPIENSCQKVLRDLRKDGSSFAEDIFVNVEAAGVMIDIRTFLRV